MHWAPPDPDYQNGIILYYLINVTEIETEVTTVHTSFSTTYSLTLLHPAYTYECVIAAYTVGLGPYSSPITVKTEEECMFKLKHAIYYAYMIIIIKVSY